MPFEIVQLAREARIVTLTFNRPEKRNALSFQMLAEILAALDEVEKSDALVLIITGHGQAFCAGMDLDELRLLVGKSQPEHVEDSQKMAHVFRRLYEFPRPTIAAVNGAAIAGGTGLATMCDFTLAVPQAKFGYTEVRVGFIPAIVSSILVWQVGHKTARELLISGRIFDAAEASELGLVDQVVSPENLMTEARALADRLTQNSPASMRAAKKLVNSFIAEFLDRDLALAVRENAAIRQTADFREGVSAFLEKRKPQWRGI